jgi:hypothetical protein
MKAFVIFRDRVTYGRQCVTALVAAGLEPVVVDHGSTWPAAVAWLCELEETGTLVLRKGGGHPREMWGWPPFIEARGDGNFLVTDPDVVPSECCPGNWVDRLLFLLDKYPAYSKVALGLRIDNLPDHYDRKQQAIDWEQKFWQQEIGDGVFEAPVDTTMALYRPGRGFLMDGMRTGFPYVADHLAWHEDFGNLPAETAYYYDHAESGISHWAVRGKSAWGD